MAFTGNASYTVAGYSAFAVEKSVAKDWHTIWTSAHPLLIAMADKGTNFNQNINLGNGTAMLIAVNGDNMTTPAAGVSDANELTADTISATNGFSQASYYITHYRANVSYRASEQFMAENGARGDILQGKKKQVLESFKERWSTDAATSTVDSRTKIMGYRYALSTSNSPGGIDQSTDTQWAAKVKTSAGTFGLNLIDDQVDSIMTEGRGAPDLILAGISGSSNMFGKIRTAIGPTAERLVNANGIAKYGLTSIEYLGAAVVLDNRAATGEINILTTDSWYVYVPKKPRVSEMYVKDGTDAYVQSYTLFTSMGCGDPALNATITGIT